MTSPPARFFVYAARFSETLALFLDGYRLDQHFCFLEKRGDWMENT